MTLPPLPNGKPRPQDKQKYQPHQLRNHVAIQARMTPKTIERYVQKGSTYSLLGGAGTLVYSIYFSNQINNVYSRKYLSVSNSGYV